MPFRRIIQPFCDHAQSPRVIVKPSLDYENAVRDHEKPLHDHERAVCDHRKALRDKRETFPDTTPPLRDDAQPLGVIESPSHNPAGVPLDNMEPFPDDGPVLIKLAKACLLAWKRLGGDIPTLLVAGKRPFATVESNSRRRKWPAEQ